MGRWGISGGIAGGRSSEGELALAMATAEVQVELRCRGSEEDGAENGNEAQGDSGGRWRG